MKIIMIIPRFLFLIHRPMLGAVQFARAQYSKGGGPALDREEAPHAYNIGPSKVAAAAFMGSSSSILPAPGG